MIDHLHSLVDAAASVAPFNALNYAFGLSSVRRRDHAVGTAIGIVPGSVAFVDLADSPRHTRRPRAQRLMSDLGLDFINEV